MKKSRLMALTVGALATFAGPVAVPATAAESHVCNALAYPYSLACSIPYNLMCDVFPTTLCH